jgi:hypothetical protein
MSSTDATERPDTGLLAVSTAVLIAGAVAALMGQMRTAGVAASVGLLGMAIGVLFVYAQMRGVL